MSTWVRRLTAAAALLAPSVSFATTGLEWKLDGPVRYQIQVSVDLPQGLRVSAQQNTEARVSLVEVAIATTCRPVEATKKGWVVGCVLDDVALRGIPVEVDQGHLLPILVEWDALLTHAEVRFEFGRDGRVREFELEGVETKIDDRRAAEIEESMRLILIRAFAPLDLGLPKNGDDESRTWRQHEMLILAFPSSVGALGTVVIEHHVTEVTGDLVDIATTATGILGAGDTISVNGSERIANYYDFEVDGTARFDRGAGHLISRDYKAVGTMTASSIDAAAGAGHPYVQIGTLRWLVEDSPPPDLGPTGEIAR